MRSAAALLALALAPVFAGCTDTPHLDFEEVRACGQPERKGHNQTGPVIQDLWTMVISNASAVEAYCPLRQTSVTPVGVSIPPPPSIEAGKQVLLHIQWDNRPSTGHRVLVDEIQDRTADGRGTPEVRVLLVSPGTGCGVGHAITHPAAAVVVDWPAERGEFNPLVVPFVAKQECSGGA